MSCISSAVPPEFLFFWSCCDYSFEILKSETFFTDLDGVMPFDVP